MTMSTGAVAVQGVLDLDLPLEVPNCRLSSKERGAVFTRSSVVDFMLDLIGYTADRPLYECRLLEPSFGGGRFVLQAVDRLVESWRNSGGTDPLDLLEALVAVELDRKTFDLFKDELIGRLIGLGISADDSTVLATSWLHCEDFLRTELPGSFDFVIGNPPYVRQELIPKELLEIYRAQFPTMVGRADLYIPFMEHSLDLLSPEGKMSFICADAWTRNDYGRGIREKIASDYALTHYIDMYGLDAFEAQVGAYPSITVIARQEPSSTRSARAKGVDKFSLQELHAALVSDTTDPDLVQEVRAVRGEHPWLLSPSYSTSIIGDLERRFPTIVDAGCRVGIGVATGADKVFIGDLSDLDVEDDRKVPLATNKDLSGGVLMWTGKGVVNPWRDEGGLVNLADYPRLEAYLAKHREQLSRRHTAKRNVERDWYKTIDRITPSLIAEPKLLVPDIKGNGDAIAYDPGSLYPHHNLYYITSEIWDLRALQALLRSGIAHLFVAAYSVKIGGGYLRFQAQNLKRIRVPLWQDIAPADQSQMRRAGEAGETLSTELLERIYKLKTGTLAFLEED